MKMTLGFSFFFFAPQHESFMNTRAHVEASFFFLSRQFNTIATSFQRPMTIVRFPPIPTCQDVLALRETDGRTETRLCVSAHFLGGWIKSIRWESTFWKGGGARAPGSQSARAEEAALKTRSAGLVDWWWTNSLLYLLIAAPLLFAFILFVKKKLPVGAFKWADLFFVFFVASLSLLTGIGDLLDSNCWTKEVIKRCYFGLFWDMNISLFFVVFFFH